MEKQTMLKGEIKDRHISYNWHDAKLSVMEGVFARGDRRLSKVLLAAQKLGAKFDGWHEFFNYDVWMEAFKQTGIDPDFYNFRERDDRGSPAVGPYRRGSHQAVFNKRKRTGQARGDYAELP